MDCRATHIRELTEQQTPRRIFTYYGKIAAAGKSFGFGDVVTGTREYPLYKVNENADYTWKYQPLADTMKEILEEDKCNDTYGRIRMYQALILK